MNTLFVPKQIPYTIETVEIGEFVKNWLPVTDINPIHQRLDTENIDQEKETNKKLSKRQEIILCIMNGFDIGEISCNEYTKGKHLYKYESIDGGHRKRAIRGFINDEFALPSVSPWGFKKYSELHSKIKKYFDEYKLRVQVFHDLSRSQIADIFQTKNTSTEVNFMEHLNAYGPIPIACGVRETARYIGADISNDYHKIFETKTTDGGKKKGVYLKMDPNRLAYDKLVCRVFCIEHTIGKKSSVACDDPELKAMYTDPRIDKITVDSLSKRVRKFLDFAVEYYAAKKNLIGSSDAARLDTDEFVTLMRLYYTYNYRYGQYKSGWKINNWRDFCKQFMYSMVQLDPSIEAKKNVTKKSTVKIRDHLDTSYGRELIEYGGKEVTRSAAFKKNNNQFSKTVHWDDNIEWFETNYMTPSLLVEHNILTILDKKRTVNSTTRAKLLTKQKFKDDITGEDLTLDNAHAGHIIPHSKGGKTTTDNLSMISAENNLKIGSGDTEQFMAEEQERQRNLSRANTGV